MSAVDVRNAVVDPSRGTCVGEPAPGLDVTIRPSDEIRDPRPEDAGEIWLRAPWVTDGYLDDDAANRQAFVEADGGRWYRTGDVGMVDDDGQLWLCGRIKHAVQGVHRSLLPIPVERRYTGHPAIRRVALVGVGPAGRQRAVLVVQTEARAREVRRALRRWVDAAGEGLEPPIDDVLITRRRLPVDARHQAKIDRLAIGRWAARRVGEPCGAR